MVFIPFSLTLMEFVFCIGFSRQGAINVNSCSYDNYLYVVHNSVRVEKSLNEIAVNEEKETDVQYWLSFH